MKNEINIKSLVFGAVLGAVVVFSVGGASEHSAEKARPEAADWEYKSLQTYANQNFDRKLNDLAKDGWAVVSSSTSQTKDSSPYAVVILKRLKGKDSDQ